MTYRPRPSVWITDFEDEDLQRFQWVPRSDSDGVLLACLGDDSKLSTFRYEDVDWETFTEFYENCLRTEGKASDLLDEYVISDPDVRSSRVDIWEENE